jgi:hypothetical protein
MASRDAKIRIEALGPPDKTAAGNSRIDESVLRLARLIGRQMAREDFERLHGKATRVRRSGGRLKERSE